METYGRPEVHLEISSGFFRIPTEQVIYNISIIAPPQSEAVRIVEKIVEVEKKTQASPSPIIEPPAQSRSKDLSPSSPEEFQDNYYKQVSNDIYQDIGKLAKSLSLTITEIPAEDRRKKRAELSEAGEKIEDAKSQLKDIVSMTESATMAIMDNVEHVQSATKSVGDLLSQLKNHKAFLLQDDFDTISRQEEKSGSEEEETTDELYGKIASAVGLVEQMRAEAPPPAPEIEEPAVHVIRKKRLLFDLDVVFQTIYELCTNETVKSHITGARQKREEMFRKDVFLDALSERVSSLSPDGDNFLNVPLTDVFSSLHEACTDKGICNLMKKMESNQSSIFLDQFLPLEMPPMTEIEVPRAPEEIQAVLPAPQSPAPEPDQRLSEIHAILNAALDLAGFLKEKKDNKALHSIPDSLSIMAKDDKADIFGKIEKAFETVSFISTDVERILESLSFQDLSGQQIMKIIKLLSDFQIQLLAIIVSFGSQLKRKEEDAAISFEEGKRLAQEDVDSYLVKLSAPETDEKVLDQTDVNSLLEQLGF